MFFVGLLLLQPSPLLVDFLPAAQAKNLGFILDSSFSHTHRQLLENPIDSTLRLHPEFDHSSPPSLLRSRQSHIISHLDSNILPIDLSASAFPSYTHGILSAGSAVIQLNCKADHVFLWLSIVKMALTCSQESPRFLQWLGKLSFPQLQPKWPPCCSYSPYLMAFMSSFCSPWRFFLWTSTAPQFLMPFAYRSPAYWGFPGHPVENGILFDFFFLFCTYHMYFIYLSCLFSASLFDVSSKRSEKFVGFVHCCISSIQDSVSYAIGNQ